MAIRQVKKQNRIRHKKVYVIIINIPLFVSVYLFLDTMQHECRLRVARFAMAF